MKSRHKGFFLLEITLNATFCLIILAVFLKCIQFVVVLNLKVIEQINIRENQRLVFQTLRQQLAFYAKHVKVITGVDGDVLVIQETAENRQLSYYRRKERGQGILYQAIQIKQGQPGVNQLTDPHNIDVLDFKVEQVDNKNLLVTLIIRDKRARKINKQQEYLPILNGEIL